MKLFPLIFLLFFASLTAEDSKTHLKPSCSKVFFNKKKCAEKKEREVCFVEPSCYSTYDPCCETHKAPYNPCCHPIGLAAGAAVFGGAVAGVILSGCSDQTATHTLRFVVNQLINLGGEEEVRIHLPNGTLFQSYLLTSDGAFPSDLIENPMNGTYAVNLILGEIQDPNNFSVDVILNGTTVILGGKFTGTFPILTFTYTLAL